MSQENVETLRAVYEAMSRRDWKATFRDVHPDFELKGRGERTRILVGTYRGLDEVRRFFEDLWEAFDEAVYEPQNFFESGDRIVVFVRSRFRPKDSSATVEIQTGHLWTFRDGKAVTCEAFPKREEALEAVGLSE